MRMGSDVLLYRMYMYTYSVLTSLDAGLILA